jgi:MEMO1 family protein
MICMPLVGAFIVPHPPLIVPEIGRGDQLKIENTTNAYQEVAKRVALLKPDTIIISSPHSTLYSDYFHISPGTGALGDFSSFHAPQVHMEVTYDQELIEVISSQALHQGISAGTAGERMKTLDHGTMVPLYFINQHLQDYKLIRLSLSGYAPIIHYRFGKLIQKVISSLEKRVVWIASGDLSHKLKADGPYGYVKEGPKFDAEITKAMQTGDFMKFLEFDESFCEKASECGLKSFILMAGALDGYSVKSELLSYEGTFGVGYAVASYEITGKSSSRHFDEVYTKSEQKKLDLIKTSEDSFVTLARQSLEYYVKTGHRITTPSHLNGELTKQRAGVFVSLKMDGKLRGCIGTISPTRSTIADEIIENAISSGTKDPRFEAVSAYELPYLIYSVDVLNPSEPIKSITELDVKRYGVIVRKGIRSGLLLPNLDGVDTQEEQVSIALHKAGISESDTYTMERFEVIRHH